MLFSSQSVKTPLILAVIFMFAGAKVGTAQTLMVNPLSVTSSDDTTATLSFSTVNQHIYQLQSSADLVNWSLLGSPVVGTGSTATVTDPIGSTNTFYRLITGAVRPGLFGQNTLAATDDGSTGLVSIGFTINLFGTNYSQCYVNNNGNLTFDSQFNTYTPAPLQTLGRVIIAPFWADVDTRASNVVTYGFQSGAVNGYDAFGVNYGGVGYFSVHADKLNNFQVVLINRADTGTGNFDAEFNYNQIQWESGDYSGGYNGYGGSACRVGISNGSNKTVELAHSGESLAFLDINPNTGQFNTATGLIYQAHNSSVPGRLVYQIRGGIVSGALQVSAGPNVSGPLPSIALSGSASDPAGGSVTVQWNLVSPQVSGTSFSDPTSTSTTFSASSAGTYTVQLTATSTTNPQNTATATARVQLY